MKSVSIGCLGSAMLTRRTATVTISAPEASTAAAFSSKLLYLPVPTISRELNLRPATVQLSVSIPGRTVTSAASDEMDDFIFVAVHDNRFAESRARDHLAVALDRDPQRIELELAQHLRNCDAGTDPAGLAVDSDREALLGVDGH